MKASAIKINGEWKDVFKRPATDASKNSKAGRLELYQKPEGEYVTADADSWVLKGKAVPVLRTVFEDGVLKIDNDFESIRQRAQVGA